MKNKLFKKTLILVLSAVMAFTQLPFADFAFAKEEAFATEQVVYDECAKVPTEAKEVQATFLSEEVYNSLNDECKDAYAEFCYEVEQYATQGYDTSGFVAGTDSEGQLILQFSLLANEFFTIENADIETIDESEIEVEDVIVFAESVSEDNIEDEASSVNNIDVYADCNADLFEDMSEDLWDGEDKEEVGFTADPESYGTLQVDDDYFVNQLSSTGKTIYKNVYSSMVKGGKNTFSYKAPTYTAGGKMFVDAEDAVNAAINTYPEKFDWIDRGASKISGLYYYNDYSVKVKITKGKYYSKSLEKQAKEKVDEVVAAARAYAASTYPDAPAYGVVEYVDKWICDNTDYNYAGTYKELKGTEEYYMCHCSYGALLMGYSVCESYALATSRILDAAGIPNQYVVGDAGGGHAWNYVMMPNEQWYLLDTTWDDNGAGGTTNKKYFLVKLDGRKASGQLWSAQKTFTFKPISATNYTKTAEQKFDFPSQMYAIKGSKFEVNMAAAGQFYGVSKPTWSVTDSKVAKVDKKGKISAKKAGTTDIIGVLGATTIKSNLTVVDKASKMTHSENGKTSIKYQVTPGSTVTLKMDILPKDGTTVSAATLAANLENFVNVTVPKKNSKVAVETVNVSGNQVTVTLKALGVGKSKVKVKCWGKSVSATITVKAQ